MDEVDIHYAHMLQKHCKYPVCKDCIFYHFTIKNMPHDIDVCRIGNPKKVWILPKKEK